MQVRLLGPVDVVVDGEPRPVRGLRRKAILAVLALNHGMVVSSDRLTNLVWGEAGLRSGGFSAAPTSLTSPPTFLGIVSGGGHCLGVTDNAHSGERLLLVKCNPFGGVYWQVLSRNAYSGDPAFELEYGGTGYCMTMPDWSGGNGEPVLLRPCQPGNGLQLWNIG